MRRIAVLITTLFLAVVGFAPTASAATTINPAAAPTGTHFQVGTATCTSDGVTVTCSSYQLAGVGNTNAEATLSTRYQATVRCRNHGGQIVDVKSQVIPVSSSTGTLQPKNGRLEVPSLTSAPAPSNATFEAQATCPNGNWTKETLPGSITVVGFTYTLHFVGFTGNFITITG